MTVVKKGRKMKKEVGADLKVEIYNSIGGVDILRIFLLIMPKLNPKMRIT